MKSKQNLTTITIGISAYNEVANIKALLQTLLAQRANNFLLEKIIVISDQSTDDTASEVNSVLNPRIKFIIDKSSQATSFPKTKILDP